MVYVPIEETVNAIESIKVRSSPDLNSLKTLNSLSARKAPTALPPPSSSDGRHSSTRLSRTVTISSKLNLSPLKYLLGPNPVILNTTSIVKTAVKKRLKLESTVISFFGISGNLSSARTNVLQMMQIVMKVSNRFAVAMMKKNRVTP